MMAKMGCSCVLSHKSTKLLKHISVYVYIWGVFSVVIAPKRGLEKGDASEKYIPDFWQHMDKLKCKLNANKQLKFPTA